MHACARSRVKFMPIGLKGYTGGRLIDPGDSHVKTDMTRPHQPEIPGRSIPRVASRWVLGVFFVAAGANHFRVPEAYLGMMPPWLPWPAGLNGVCGACEILGGTGLFIRPLRTAAGWGLIALLVAVFPANLHVALMGRMPGSSFSPMALWLRLPLQAVLVAWVAWAAIAGRQRRAPANP
jgi:uncharacterized membrane protein